MYMLATGFATMSAVKNAGFMFQQLYGGPDVFVDRSRPNGHATKCCPLCIGLLFAVGCIFSDVTAYC